MKLSQDEHNLNFFSDGIEYSAMARVSSEDHLEKLWEHGLIKIDSSKRVYLTDRGRVARKIGIKKYLEIERFEKEIKEKGCNSEVYKSNYIFIVIMSILLLVFALVLGYVSWIIDFQ